MLKTISLLGLFLLPPASFAGAIGGQNANDSRGNCCINCALNGNPAAIACLNSQKEGRGPAPTTSNTKQSGSTDVAK